MTKENSPKKRDKKKKDLTFGPLKAAKNNDYQIKGEDWGCLF